MRIIVIKNKTMNYFKLTKSGMMYLFKNKSNKCRMNEPV